MDVLLIDDEKVFLKSLAEGLGIRPWNFSVLTANGAAEAIDMLRTVSVDVVVTDLNMPGMNGFELMRHLRDQRPHTPIVVMSARPRESVDHDLQDLSVAAYLEKPVDLGNVAETILHAQRRHDPLRSAHTKNSARRHTP